MVVGRCERSGPPTETKHKYSHAHKLNFAHSGHMLCGSGRQAASIIWLHNVKRSNNIFVASSLFRIARKGEVRVT
jgi:hypothetical protein